MASTIKAFIEARVRLSSREQQIAAPRGRLRPPNVLVQVVARALELVGAEISRNVEDFVLDLAVVDHEDGQHAMARQRQELDLPQRRLRAPRHGHDAREARDGRQQIRHRQRERLRVARGFGQALAEAQELFAFRRRELDQCVDEEAIALVRRHAPGRRVRRAYEAELLEIGNDVANRRRAQIQTGLARQRARADRLPVANVLFDEKPQQESARVRPRRLEVCRSS